MQLKLNNMDLGREFNTEFQDVIDDIWRETKKEVNMKTLVLVRDTIKDDVWQIVYDELPNTQKIDV